MTRGAGSPATALALVFKPVESAQERWRAITGAQLVPPVRAGARFPDDVFVERSAEAAVLGATTAPDQPQADVRVLLDPAGRPCRRCLDEGYRLTHPSRAPRHSTIAPPMDRPLLCVSR